MVGATLASIRHYCPDVPICLTVDGECDVSDLEELYDLIVLRIVDLPSQEMRDLISGSYRAKLAPMWEGPFEHYVWLDSDAIVWGDFTSEIRTDIDFQIFWPEISIPEDAAEVPSWLAHFYFNLDKLQQFDPDFEWRGHPYFSAGVYACRRNVITYEEWLEMESWDSQVPGGIFKFGDQGILNYLVLAKGQRGQIKTVRTDLQWARSFGLRMLKQECAGSGWKFPRIENKPRILHFCGSKPYTFNLRCYCRPFTIARLVHHRRSHSYLGAWLAIFREDGKVLWSKLLGKLKRRLGLS